MSYRHITPFDSNGYRCGVSASVYGYENAPHRSMERQGARGPPAWGPFVGPGFGVASWSYRAGALHGASLRKGTHRRRYSRRRTPPSLTRSAHSIRAARGLVWTTRPVSSTPGAGVHTTQRGTPSGRTDRSGVGVSISRGSPRAGKIAASLCIRFPGGMGCMFMHRRGRADPRRNPQRSRNPESPHHDATNAGFRVHRERRPRVPCNGDYVKAGRVRVHIYTSPQERRAHRTRAARRSTTAASAAASVGVRHPGRSCIRLSANDSGTADARRPSCASSSTPGDRSG